jgi:hypothetical protein
VELLTSGSTNCAETALLVPVGGYTRRSCGGDGGARLRRARGRDARLAVIAVPSIVRHFRADLERPDPHWPAQLAALVTVLLYLTLPNKLTIGPSWLVPVLEALLLVALVLATPGDEVPGTQMRQRLAVGLVSLLAVATLVALGLLAHFVVEGGSAGGLIEAAIVLWGTIVLVFALVYWELDRGGPLARAHSHLTGPNDFLFTQSTAEGRELAPNWQPSFVDYLYLSLTNSTAYSPTDTMPLTGRAKMTMGLQSLASLVTIGLLVARAVGSLR